MCRHGQPSLSSKSDYPWSRNERARAHEAVASRRSCDRACRLPASSRTAGSIRGSRRWPSTAERGVTGYRHRDMSTGFGYHGSSSGHASSSGLEAIQAHQRLLAQASARVLVFSMHVSPDFAMAALRAGALGYVTKGVAASRICSFVYGRLPTYLRGQRALRPRHCPGLDAGATCRAAPAARGTHAARIRCRFSMALSPPQGVQRDRAPILHLSAKTVAELSLSDQEQVRRE